MAIHVEGSVHALLCLMLVAAIAGCSTFTGYGIGPALVAGDGGRGAGLVAEAAAGKGGAAEKSSSFLEARARVLVTHEHQQVAGLVGFSSLLWVRSSAAISLGVGGGFGVEHATDRAFLNPIAQARVGTGFVLSASERIRDANWWGREAGCPQYVRDRTTTLLNVGLASDIDGRFTRSAFFAVQLVVGIAFVDEVGIPLGPTDPRPRGYAGCP